MEQMEKKEFCNKCKQPLVNGKCKNCGRPTKLTDKFIEIAKKILDEDMNAIILTDEDLIFLINEELKKENIETIANSTFRNWKANNKEDNIDELDEMGKEFLALIKNALIRERNNLFEKLKTEEAGLWQKYAWIIERKFDEWNLRQKHDVKSKSISARAKIDLSKLSPAALKELDLATDNNQ